MQRRIEPWSQRPAACQLAMNLEKCWTCLQFWVRCCAGIVWWNAWIQGCRERSQIGRSCRISKQPRLHCSSACEASSRPTIAQLQNSVNYVRLPGLRNGMHACTSKPCVLQMTWNQCNYQLLCQITGSPHLPESQYPSLLQSKQVSMCLGHIVICSGQTLLACIRSGQQHRSWAYKALMTRAQPAQQCFCSLLHLLELA